MRTACRAGVVVLAVVTLVGCSSAAERREQALRLTQDTLSSALLRYGELKGRAATAAGRAGRITEGIQEEILDLERKIREARDAIARIQSGVGEVTGGVQDLGQAVGGAPGEGPQAPTAGDPQEMTTAGELGTAEEPLDATPIGPEALRAERRGVAPAGAPGETVEEGGIEGER